MRVAIIIPIHNNMPYLERCLDSLFAMNYKPQIFAVDINSTDGGDKLLRNYSNLNYKIYKTMYRPAVVVNRVADIAIKAKCGGIFIMNPNDYVAPRFLRCLIDELVKDENAMVMSDSLVFDGRSFKGWNYINENTVVQRLGLVSSHTWQTLGGLNANRKNPYKDFTERFLKTGEVKVIHEDIYYQKATDLIDEVNVSNFSMFNL